MAKFYVLFALLIVAVAAASAAPIQDEDSPQWEMEAQFEEVVTEERADRHRRVTCDLLSFGGKVGNSACAANCLSMGKAGGYCNGRGVCVCRKETLGDLWKKRFG